MKLVLGAVALLGGCSEAQRRDATSEEVRAAAVKCGAVVSRIGRWADQNNGPSNRELGMPNISVTIKTEGVSDFNAKAVCIDHALADLNAYSSIYGPNGEDLLVSSGRDRIL